MSPAITNAQIYEPDGLRMPGDWNAWANTTAMGGDFDLIKNSTGTLRWQTTFQYTGTTGNQEFKFVSTSFGNPWGNQWAGNASFTVNAFSTVTYGPTVDPNNKIAVTNNKWYAVNYEDLGYADTRAIFMETSSEPVEIVSAEQHPLLVTDQDNVTVTISLSAAPSPEEKFYLRYSTNNWISSSIATISISATTGTAVIPPQPNDTTVNWYVFSSTLSNPLQDFDLITIHINNNGGSNYNYTVGQSVTCGQAIDVVTTDPAFPLDASPVLIYFNAEMGNGGLYNYTGDVYAHTGVITNLSTSNSDWKYVKTEWGQNTPETKLTRLSANLYSLQIENIRQYYGVPAAENILKIALVFRGGAELTTGGYPEHKNADGSDILIDVYEPQLNVKITNPSDREPLVSPNEVLAVCVEAIYNQSLSVFLDDSLLTTTAGQQITFPLELQGMAPGTYWIKASAQGITSEARDSVSIYLRGPVIVQELPQGMKAGINYINNSTVTLVLNDPAAKKSFAFAIGEYSNWVPDDNNYMKRTPDGKNYWVTITGLQPQKEYTYQYYIDGELKLADAYADKVLDPWNDRWIPAANYPDLKAYPFDKTLGTVSVFQTGQTPYPWTITGFTPPAVNETQQDLMIYELLLRDFTEEKNLEAALSKLDYLKGLGINAIELMPVTEFDGNESWGYAPNFFFATDKYYGNRAKYKQFIDECHKRGIAVIMDIVTNHSYGGCPMVQMYFDPQAGEYGQPSAQNPWFNPQAPHPFSIGYDFNHESTATRDFIKQVLGYWMTEYKIDGFRFDLSKGLTQTYSGSDLGAWSAYDQSRINILTDYYNHIKSVNDKALMICEHFAVNDEEKVLANTGMLLWSAMHNNYKQVGMGWPDNSDISWAYHANRGWNYPNLVDYMENHDEERLMFENLSYGNSSGAYNIKDTLTSLHHMQMASVMFMGIPGPKMLWQFGETGYDYSIMFNGDRTSAKPPRWDYFDQPARQELYRVYAGMAKLRKSDAYRFGSFTSNLGGLQKRMWIAHSSMNVVIAGNMDVNSTDMAPGFQQAGNWYNYFTGETVNITDPAGHSFNFGPGEYKVFTNVQLPKPFNHLNFTVTDSVSGVPVIGATISLQESGQQKTGLQGKAAFTSALPSAKVTVKISGYKDYNRTYQITSDLNINILMKKSSGIGIDDPQTPGLPALYPNPAHDRITIRAEQKFRIDCFSPDGRLLMTHQMESLTEMLNISHLSRGLYLLHFTGNGVSFTTKVTKE